MGSRYTRSPMNDRIYTPPANANIPRNRLPTFQAPQLDYSGLEEAGRSMQQLAAAGFQYYAGKQARDKAEQEKLDTRASIRKFSEFQIGEMKRNTEFRSTYSGSFDDYAQNDIDDLDKFYSNYDVSDLSPGAQEKFSAMYDQYKVRSVANSIGYQTQAVAAETVRDVQSGIDNLINDTLLNPFDNFETNQSLMDQMIMTMEGKVPRDKIEEFRSDIVSRHGLAMIRGRANADPTGTLKALEAGEYNHLLSAEGLFTAMNGLKKQIEAEREQELRHYRTQIASQIADHTASLFSTNTPVLTEEQVAKAEDPELMQEFQFATRVGRAAYSIVRGAENKPVEEQLRMVDDALKPKPGSSTFADEEAVWGRVRSMVVENHKSFMEDKVSASLDNVKVQQAFNRSHQEGVMASLEWQVGKGTPFHHLQVAPKEAVLKDADELNNLINNGQWDQAKAKWNELQNTWSIGTLDNGKTTWDIYQEQLMNAEGNKVPDDFIAAMRYQRLPEGGEIFQAYSTSVQDLKTVLGKDSSGADLYGTVQIEVSGLHNQYSQVISSIPGFGGSKQLASERTLMTKYAAYLTSKGVDPRDAAKRAFNTLYPHEVILNDKNKLIIPKNINGVTLNRARIETNLQIRRNKDEILRFMSQGVKEGQSSGVVKLSVKDNYGNNKGGDVLMRWDAAQAFEEAQGIVKRLSNGKKSVLVNSGVRSLEEQRKTQASNAKINRAAAAPGMSTHNVEFGGGKGGTGLDVENYNDPLVRQALEKVGYVWKNYKNDPFHFEFVGNAYSQSLPNRLADPSRRDRVADSASKIGVWIVDPDLRSATLYTKNNDGSVTAVRNGYNQPYRFSYNELNVSDSLNPYVKPRVTSAPKKNQAQAVQNKRAETKNVSYQKTTGLASQLSGGKVTDARDAAAIIERGF